METESMRSGLQRERALYNLDTFESCQRVHDRYHDIRRQHAIIMRIDHLTHLCMSHVLGYVVNGGVEKDMSDDPQPTTKDG